MRNSIEQNEFGAFVTVFHPYRNGKARVFKTWMGAFRYLERVGAV